MRRRVCHEGTNGGGIKEENRARRDGGIEEENTLQRREGIGGLANRKGWVDQEDWRIGRGLGELQGLGGMRQRFLPIVK